MTRPLGLYERFSLARTLVGTPPILVFLASLPSGAKVLKKEDVELAVAELLRRYAILGCIVEGGRGREPRFVGKEEISAAQVVEVREEDGAREEEVLRRGLEEGKQSFEVEKGPLWRVVLFGEGKHEEGKQRVLLILNHVLSDGTGTRNLFAELLALLHTPPPSPSSPSPTKEILITLPPTQESTVDLRPSYAHIARIIFTELLLPRLPSFLQPKPSPPTWPNPPLLHPLSQPTALKLLTIPQPLLAAIKTQAKAHGIPTLHPILHTAALASLTIALSSSSSSSDDDDALPPILGETPLSIRSSSLGHPLATGNYVDSLPTISPSSSTSFSLRTPFWATAREYATQLTRREKGKSGMGMLAYIPDQPLPLSGAEGERGRNGFEKFVEDKAGSRSPYSAGFEVSNLGVLPRTGWESAEEGATAAAGGVQVSWAQTGPAVGPALCLNALTIHGSDLRMTLTWKQGVIAEEVVDLFWETYEKVLRRVGGSSAFKEGEGERGAGFGEMV